MKLALLAAVLAACATTAGGSDPAPEPPVLALAADLPAVCDGPEMVRITRPVATDDPSLGTFSYGFRYKPAAAGAPVLVYVPGGPGMTSIDQVPGMLPASWGYLLTDPRGVGCNRLAQLPTPDVAAAFWRSEQVSRDVLAAIADRQLDDYLVFGISYGTEVATLIASEVDSQQQAGLRAVVLEGVLGRYFMPGEYYATAVSAQWDDLRALMPADVRTELDTAPSPFGIAPLGWSRALDQILLGGTAIVSLELAALSPSVPAIIRDPAMSALQMYADTPELADPASIQLYRQTASR